MAIAHRAIRYADERLDALLSITGRMDGFLYRCRNDAGYTMLYMSEGISTLSRYPPNEFIHSQVRDYSSIIHPDDLPSVYAAVDSALEVRRNWNIDYRIISREGDAVWVREIGGGVFSEGKLVFLEGFVIDITDRKQIEDINVQLLKQLKAANEELLAQKRALEIAKQQSDHSANHDALTGLPNRRAFQDKLKEAIALSTTSATAASLLLIDLDRFKEVNDTLGHDAGDDVLRRISERLRAILEKEDFIARIGGDEFASLVFADTRQIRRKAALLGRQILHKLQIEVPTPTGMIRLGCTLGIATCPGDATDAEGLMALADRLLYIGKKDGRNQVVTADQLATGRLARQTGG